MLAEEGRWRGGQWLQPSRGRIWAQLFASLYFPASFKQDNSTLQNPLEKMHDSLESSVSLATELQRESFVLTCIYAQLRSSVVSVHPSIPLTRVEKKLTTERYFKENPFWVGLEQRTGKDSTRERKYDWKSLFWEAGEEQYRPWQWVRVPGGTASWEAAASAGSIQKTCLHCKMQGSPQSFIVLLASSCSLLTHCVSRAEHRTIPKQLYCRGATAAGRGVPSPWHRSELQEEEEGVSEAQNGAAPPSLPQSTWCWWSEARLTPMSPSYLPDHRASIPDAGGRQGVGTSVRLCWLTLPPAASLWDLGREDALWDLAIPRHVGPAWETCW